jgi:hypothetical protein
MKKDRKYVGRLKVKFSLSTLRKKAAIAQSVQRLATGWTVQRSNSGGDEIFRTLPDRQCGPPSFLYKEYCVCFPEINQSGRGVDHPHPSNAEVKEVEEYLYFPFGF